MIQTVTLKAAGAVALAAFLAGCQMAGPSGSRPMVSAAPQMQTGIEGEWMSTDGVATSRFYNGAFETVANDTGNRLSEGRYTMAAGQAQISGMSLVRQQPISFNCLLVGTGQLNCTAAGGNQFSLIRRQVG